MSPQSRAFNRSRSDSPDYCATHFHAAFQRRLLSVRRGDLTLATRDSAASSVVNQSHTLGPRLFRRLGILSRGSYIKGAIERRGNTGDSVAETFLIFASEHQRRTETFLTLSQPVLPPRPDLRRLSPPPAPLDASAPPGEASLICPCLRPRLWQENNSVSPCGCSQTN